MAEPISVIAAVNDDEVCKRNLLASPGLMDDRPIEIILQKGFRSASVAYNDAMDRAANDLLIFVHQDVYFPDSWFAALSGTIHLLEERQCEWGVLGAYGVTAEGRHCGRIYSTGLGIIGDPITEPVEVRTLDEIVLIMRRSSGLRFDECLPSFHFYGTDICLRASESGRPSFAIPGFCIHNTHQLLVLPEDFYQGYRYIKSRWRDKLPIQTSCIRISPFDSDVHVRKAKKTLRSLLRKTPHPVGRVREPEELFAQLEKQYG